MIQTPDLPNIKKTLTSAQQRKLFKDKAKCHDCRVPLQTSITGRRFITLRNKKKAEVCDDCYYDRLGDFIERNPIHRPGG